METKLDKKYQVTKTTKEKKPLVEPKSVYVPSKAFKGCFPYPLICFQKQTPTRVPGFALILSPLLKQSRRMSGARAVSDSQQVYPRSG